jgi:hypothetical protein
LTTFRFSFNIKNIKNEGKLAGAVADFSLGPVFLQGIYLCKKMENKNATV